MHEQFDIYMLHARDFFFFLIFKCNRNATLLDTTPTKHAGTCTLLFLFLTIEQFRISSITFFSVSQSHSVPGSIIFRGIPAHKRPFKLSPVRSRTMKQGGMGGGGRRGCERFCLSISMFEKLRSIVCTRDR